MTIKRGGRGPFHVSRTSGRAGDGAVAGVSPAFDITINSSNYDYSINSGKTAKNSGNTTNTLAMSVATKSTGKWYFEVLNDAGTDEVGIGDATANTASFGGVDTHSIGYTAAGSIFYNSGSVASTTSYATGDRLAVALDADNKKVWFGKISAGVITWENSSDPATATGGRTMTSATGPFRAFVQCNSLADQATICLAAADQTATSPSGFSTWA